MRLSTACIRRIRAFKGIAGKQKKEEIPMDRQSLCGFILMILLQKEKMNPVSDPCFKVDAAGMDDNKNTSYAAPSKASKNPMGCLCYSESI